MILLEIIFTELLIGDSLQTHNLKTLHNAKDLPRRQIHLLKRTKRKYIQDLSDLYKMLHTWFRCASGFEGFYIRCSRSPEYATIIQKQYCILRMKVQLPRMAQERKSDPKKIPGPSLQTCTKH